MLHVDRVLHQASWGSNSLNTNKFTLEYPPQSGPLIAAESSAPAWQVVHAAVGEQPGEQIGVVVVSQADAALAVAAHLLQQLLLAEQSLTGEAIGRQGCQLLLQLLLLDHCRLGRLLLLLPL